MKPYDDEGGVTTEVSETWRDEVAKQTDVSPDGRGWKSNTTSPMLAAAALAHAASESAYAMECIAMAIKGHNPVAAGMLATYAARLRSGILTYQGAS